MEEKLVFDVGNTRIKGGRFHGSKLVDIFYVESAESLVELIGSSESPAIVSSVVMTSDIFETLPAKKRPLFLDRQTTLPIQLNYDTPETLGMDRLAAAVGGYTEFPGERVLIMDLGTCNTYDIIDHQGTFHGGIISPGYNMRMRSMHEMTGRLPDISMDQFSSTNFPGKSTRECMYLGAREGMAMEINGFIDQFKKEFDLSRVIVTGGSASSFESFIKPPIFVRPEIVLVGLHRILDDHEAD
ncbi:MAG: type III pantothenate kinase [Cytophagales bacterium]|nr:type III pantothenate kinase [Cytophagales bacterium]